MKTVVISRNEKELARVPLNKKSILAGRSPSCDAVIRYKGLKPIQFLIEHVSENLEENLPGNGESSGDGFSSSATDFNAGFWTLIDVSETHQKEAHSGGAGIVIDESHQEFKGFHFKVVSDKLSATELKKGVLTRAISHSLVAASKDRSVVEVVYFRKDIDIVTDIVHYSRKKFGKKVKLFPQQLPDFIFEWQNISDITAVIKSDSLRGRAEIFRRGESLTEELEVNRQIALRREDMIHIETVNDDFYLRFVPEVQVSLEKLPWTKDYMVRVTFAVFAIVTTLFFLVKNFVPLEEEKAAPPRIIQINLPPAPQPPPQPPPLPPVEVPPAEEVLPEPAPVVEKVVKAPPPAEKKPEKKPEKPQAKADPTPAPTPIPPPAIKIEESKPKPETMAAKPSVVQRPKELPKAGLNNNAPAKNVNTIGLLGKLKSGQKSTNQKVSADAVLNQGVTVDAVVGDTGTVVVNKPPAGALGQSKIPSSKNGLAAASTTLSGATNADPRSTGSIALANGKSRFSSGTKLNGLKGTGGGSGDQNGVGEGRRQGLGDSGSGGLGLDRGDAMQVVGGLDKEAIRKALRENRRAITNCYETALLTRKQLDGRMTFRWVISLDGTVASIKLQSSEFKMPNFESCVESVIKAIKFPQAPNRMTTTVIYPFVFQGKK